MECSQVQGLSAGPLALHSKAAVTPCSCSSDNTSANTDGVWQRSKAPENGQHGGLQLHTTSVGERVYGQSTVLVCHSAGHSTPNSVVLNGECISEGKAECQSWDDLCTKPPRPQLSPMFLSIQVRLMEEVLFRPQSSFPDW